MNKKKMYIFNIYNNNNLIYSTTICARNLDYALDSVVIELEKKFPNFIVGTKIVIEEV